MADFVRVPGLVLDASFLINLLATQECKALVEAINLHCVTTDAAAREVLRHPVTGKAFSDPEEAIEWLQPVVAHGLDPDGVARYIDLVAAPPPNGLGDGEAACIAAAHRLGYGICLDDGRARRIVAECYPDLSVWWSIELLAHPRVEKVLGKERVAECIVRARTFGRMRMPPGWTK
jgi:hypothetical protein